MEVICTFIFVLFILHVTGKHTGNSAPESSVFILPSICIVLWGLCNVDYFTSASFNPALAIGSTVFQYWWYPNNPMDVMMHYMWYYIGGAALGGISAGMFYHLYSPLFIDHDRESRSPSVASSSHAYQTKIQNSLD